ncbi:MAG: KamA family radical SAM protein [Verrucomicrobiae bacterium]|nr:KamA family radical SAM protein [Verrucomicrobiae bacterium]
MQHPPEFDLDKTFRTHGPGYWSGRSVTPEDWNSHIWQLKNRITSLAQLEEHLVLTQEERSGVILSGTKLAMAITPHFFNLIDRDNPDCPIRRQVIPRIEETLVSPYEMTDPCGEDSHMPVPGLVHRYPDRVLFLVTDRCASYCRYCTRSRVVSGVGDQELETDYEAAFRYLEQHHEVRDVLLSGGDPLIFSDSKLEKILERLRRIPHLEFLRIGSRVPVFLPQRITPELCSMLRRYHPLFMSVHVNHPRELTLEVKEALERLSDSGIPLGNQSVLLKGVNDDLDTMRTLVHKLLMCRVRPYYLYQLDLIRGSSHLEVPVAEGIRLIEGLRGHTTGYAVPQYVIDAPGGGGKVPVNPDYVLKKTAEGTLIRNFEGRTFEYPEPSTIGAELLDY